MLQYSLSMKSGKYIVGLIFIAANVVVYSFFFKYLKLDLMEASIISFFPLSGLAGFIVSENVKSKWFKTLIVTYSISAFLLFFLTCFLLWFTSGFQFDS